MFDNINKVVAEGKKRWDKIEELVEVIRNPSKFSVEISSDDYTKTIGMLLIALVDHMRPMNPTEEQLGEAKKGIEDLLKSLK